MTQTVTVRLPEQALERFRRGAQAAGKPLEQFLVDRLVEAVPPSEENLPPPLHEELCALEHLDDQSLQRLAGCRFAAQRRYSRLLAKYAAGTITEREREQLAALGEQARHLTLKKAHAYLVLRWRGHVIPSREELEIP